MLDAQGISLLRMLIMKMWALNEARQNGDCQAMADEINGWMPPEAKVIEPADIAKALGRVNSHPVVNVELLRDSIDRIPYLFSARLNGDYQAILNEVLKIPECANATLVDVIEAMATRTVSRPDATVSGTVKMVGISRLG